ncbi:MAG TPA: metalloregulator ArsR/SmtB family transcription factor [Erysipelotrichaceae bacterium]|nr:metalloregulator ArsR/SmtB family transcription factor [Erysipelotrichaceae bacterium]
MQFKDFADFFKALADDSRIKIIALLLNEKEMNQKDLLENFNISQPTFSYHMKELTNAKLVKIRKVGTAHFYSVNKNIFNELNDAFLKLVSEQ